MIGERAVERTQSVDKFSPQTQQTQVYNSLSCVLPSNASLVNTNTFLVKGAAAG